MFGGTGEPAHNPCTTRSLCVQRAGIEAWLVDHDTSPLTGEALGSKAVTANFALRNAIIEWRTKHHKLIPRAAIDLHEKIGEGSFKRVHRGTLSMPGAKSPTTVAVLQVHSGNVAAEAETLLRLGQHPRLVSFFGLCKEGPESTLLVMEFAARGSLDKALEEIEDSITPAHRLAMLQQVCSGCEALVAAKLIHRDMALRNVLLFFYDAGDFKKTSVKLSDFGLTVNAYTATHKCVPRGAAQRMFSIPAHLSLANPPCSCLLGDGSLANPKLRGRTRMITTVYVHVRWFACCRPCYVGTSPTARSRFGTSRLSRSKRAGTRRKAMSGASA